MINKIDDILGSYDVAAEGWARCADPQWMAMVAELFGVASTACSIMSHTRATELVPFLGIISSPVYVVHAAKEAYEQSRLTVAAAKAGRVADTFFWAVNSAGALGGTISEVIKPFVGGAALFSLAWIPGFHTTFFVVIPIAVIALNVLEGVGRGWVLYRTESELEKLLSTRTVQHLFPRDLSDLERENFDSAHFTSDARKEALYRMKGKSASPEIREAFESEMHRKILEQNMKVIASIISIVSAVIFLVGYTRLDGVAYGFSLGASGLIITHIVITKSVSQKRFLQIERSLKLLSSPSSHQ